MANNTARIEIEFAMRLLRTLHQLDEPLGEVDTVLTAMEQGPDKARLKEALVTLIEVVYFSLMDPIYREHPELGTSTEPGPWLKDDSAK
jgi:hypothetical protein